MKWTVLLLFLGVASGFGQPTNTPPPAIKLPVSPDSDAPVTGNLDQLDSEFGFRGIKLGSELKEIPGLVSQFKYKGTQSFRLETDPLRFGAFPLDSVSYEFYKEKLFEINIWVKGTIAPGLVAEFKRRYGEPQPIEKPRMLAWNAPQVMLLCRWMDDGLVNVQFMLKSLKSEVAEMKKTKSFLDAE